MINSVKDINCSDKETVVKVKPAFPSITAYEHTALGFLYSRLSTLISHEQRNFQKDRKFCESRYKLGHYPFIARPTESIVQMVLHLREYYSEKGIDRSKIKVLDCGCGIGNVVMLFASAGFNAHGVEYDERTIEVGRKFLERFNVNPDRIHQGDLLKYNDFDKYDVIYGYCPLANHKLEYDFEMHMIDQIKAGAMVFGLDRVAGTVMFNNNRYIFQRLVLKNQSHLANPWVKVSEERNVEKRSA